MSGSKPFTLHGKLKFHKEVVEGEVRVPEHLRVRRQYGAGTRRVRSSPSALLRTVIPPE